MVPATFRPDWLLSPPPRNPYLTKSEYFFRPTVVDRTMNKIYNIAFGQESEEFRRYIKRDEGLEIGRAQLNTKRMQQQIRGQSSPSLMDDSKKEGLLDSK